MNEIPGLNLLPEKYRGPVLLAGAIVMYAGPYVTRAWHAWKNDGGWAGIKNAILFGTNTPKGPAGPAAGTTPEETK